MKLFPLIDCMHFRSFNQSAAAFYTIAFIDEEEEEKDEEEEENETKRKCYETNDEKEDKNFPGGVCANDNIITFWKEENGKGDKKEKGEEEGEEEGEKGCEKGCEKKKEKTNKEQEGKSKESKKGKAEEEGEDVLFLIGLDNNNNQTEVSVNTGSEDLITL